MKQYDKISTEKHIDEILSRGVGTFIDPNGNFRKKLVAKSMGQYNKEIIVKFGVDPTRPDIHLGHAVVLRKLRQLQDLGCKIIFLIGDFTTLIGDPTGKSKVRPEVDFAIISENMETYLSQIDKVLLVERKNGVIVDSPHFGWIRNSDWFFGVTDISAEGASDEGLTIKFDETNQSVVLPKSSFLGKAALYENTRMQKTHLSRVKTHGVSLVNLLSVLRRVSHSQLLERDMFQQRIASNEPLFMHEMLYPVIQGIDSSVLHNIYGSCDLEVGGTDQTFNMLMGRRVMEMTNQEPQAVLALNLLVGLDGKEKMSKSLDNYIAITDTPNEMFGKIMSINDGALEMFYALCTFTPKEEVERIILDVKIGKLHPMEVKIELAQQIVEIYHGRGKALGARDAFSVMFQERAIPKDIPEVFVDRGTALLDILLQEKIVSSKTAFRRLVSDGAIKINGEEKIEDQFYIPLEDAVYKIGKHRFLRIKMR